MGLFTKWRNGHDPTLNVRELFEAGSQRQDDLRGQESKHVRELMGLRASFYKELRKAETDRIDAIRAVDVGNVNMAAQQQGTVAQSLAGQVAAAAEAMRTTVAAAATATANNLTAVVGPIIKDVSELRQAMYQQQGERAQHAEGRDTNQWVISSLILGASVLIGAGTLLFYRQQGQRQVRTDSKVDNRWVITTAVALVVAVATISLALSGHLK